VGAPEVEDKTAGGGAAVLKAASAFGLRASGFRLRANACAAFLRRDLPSLSVSPENKVWAWLRRALDGSLLRSKSGYRPRLG
jgi:hypothetical protein